MTDEEIQEYEHGLLKLQYDEFSSVLDSFNGSESSTKKITLSIMNSFTLNAHAIKHNDNQYEIIIRSGVIPFVFQIIGENSDYFSKKFGHLENIEDGVAWACVFVWKQIFAHELGHIVRGHNDLVAENGLFDLIDDSLNLSSTYFSEKYNGNVDMLRMLMEYDADIYSSAYVTEQILRLIGHLKSECYDISERDVIKLACSSIFLFFNFVAEKEGVSNKYPPSIVRSIIIHECFLHGLSGRVTLSDIELKDAMHEAISDCINFLIEECYLNLDGAKSFWEYAKIVECKLKDEYPTFLNVIQPWR